MRQIAKSGLALAGRRDDFFRDMFPHSMIVAVRRQFPAKILKRRAMKM
jgi:hypothetical protein